MIIYKTTNLLNGKIYIGQDSLNRQNYLGSGRAISKALKKYGKENFKKEILCNCSSKEELDEKEIYFINLFKSTDRKLGYNISAGGGGALGIKLSNERKQIISKANKGKIMSVETRNKISKAHKGKSFSEEHKKNIKLNHHNVSGINNPMFNKKHSEKTKKIISQKNKGYKPTKEALKKMSINSTGENNSRAKLTEKDVIKIRNLYSQSNMTLTEISKIYNVQFSCIEKIVKKRTWKHVI